MKGHLGGSSFKMSLRVRRTASVPGSTFGTVQEFLHPAHVRERDTLIVACSEPGVAPDKDSLKTVNGREILSTLPLQYPLESNAKVATDLLLTTSSLARKV